jgi:hypothetical protein
MNVPSTTDAQRSRAPSASRRAVLAGLGTLATAGLAGCTDIVNAVADEALEDVNVFNETPEALSGSVTVLAPDGSTALGERFELKAKEPDEPTEGATAVYSDVWQESGAYEVTVEVTDSVYGAVERTRTAEVNDPDEEMLAVGFGVEGEEPVTFVVADEFTDFATQ